MSSADTILDVFSMIIGLLIIAIQQWVAIELLAPLADVVASGDFDNIGIYGGEQTVNSLFAVTVKWSPMLIGAGFIGLGIFRIYRRHRVEQQRQQLIQGGQPPLR